MDSKIDFGRSNVSRYIQLSTLFRRKIMTADWPAGRQIPTIEELAEEFGVARATIRQALELLEKDGLISRFRARGTFVNARPVTPTWCEVETNWDGLLANRDGATIEILRDVRSIPLPPIELPIGQPTPSYRHLRRRHVRDNQKYLVADVYIDDKLASKIDEAEFTKTSALRLAASIPKVTIVDARQIMTIGIADLDTANQLDIPLNAPVFFVDRFAVDRRGRLILVSRGVYRGDIIKLDFKLR